MHSTIWNPDAVRAMYKKSVEVCERFFAERKRPESANGQAFYDLCLAEYAVRKHLADADCFSSREALISALRQLLANPVEPPILPCRADQYLACQRQDIEFEIKVLETEQLPPPEAKPWYQTSRLFNWLLGAFLGLWLFAGIIMSSLASVFLRTAGVVLLVLFVAAYIYIAYCRKHRS